MIYSTFLGAETYIVGSGVPVLFDSTLYTAPLEGSTTVVRDVCVSVQDVPSEAFLRIIVVGDPEIAQVDLIYAVPSSSFISLYHWEGRLVMNPGSHIAFTGQSGGSGPAGVFNAWASGYVLTP